VVDVEHEEPWHQVVQHQEGHCGQLIIHQGQAPTDS
jgi:hypothetical protein